MVRKIEGKLISVRVLPERPGCIPLSRPRGSKAAGLRYERELVKGLKVAKHGLWIEWEDSAGKHFCQPDIICKFKNQVAVLECKYTWTREGHEQLGLYVPLVERLVGQKVKGIVVCKKLLSSMPRVQVFGDLESCLGVEGSQAVWHYIGGVPRVRSFKGGRIDAAASLCVA